MSADAPGSGHLDVPVKPGDVLAGKYVVERVLGAGGMGVVVAARHNVLNELVALKFLLPQAVSKVENVARFLREAQAAVRIKSEHVARVSDVGTLASGAPYIVMEHLSGSDLADLVRQRGALPVDEAVGYVLQACEAIAEAHALGIVHRDLKPANLFLTRRMGGAPLIKVLDFGIAKALQHDTPIGDVSLTATNAVMGSPLYMSPEQVRSSKNIDARSDIWALGVILHELVTGDVPFRADTFSALLAALMVDPPVPIRAVRPDLPVELEAVVLKCLEKDAARRYGGIAELARALLPFSPKSRSSVERITSIVGGLDATMMPSHPPPHTLPVLATSAGASTTAQGGWVGTTSGKRRGVSVAVGVLVAGVIAGGVALRWSKRGDSSTEGSLLATTTVPASASATATPTTDAPTASASSTAVAAPSGGANVHSVPSAAPTPPIVGVPGGKARGPAVPKPLAEPKAAPTPPVPAGRSAVPESRD